MREIKFRAWNNNPWFMTSIVTLVDVYNWFAWLNWKEIMQYTWLKDKNGKDIYEGDIIWWSYFCEQDKIIENSVVTFEDWMFLCNDDIRPDFVQREIIWNIYENPNLLTK